MHKEELIDVLEEKQDELYGLLENLAEETMLEPGVSGQWSIKDVLVHLAHWEAQLVTLLYQARQGSKPTTAHFSPQKEEEINAAWVEQGRERPLDLILADLDGAHNQIIRRLDAFSESELNDPKRFPWAGSSPLTTWIAESSYAHIEEHLDQIRAWLASKPAANADQI